MDEELRMTALKLASDYEIAKQDWVDPNDVLARAKAYYEFLKEG